MLPLACKCVRLEFGETGALLLCGLGLCTTDLSLLYLLDPPLFFCFEGVRSFFSHDCRSSAAFNADCRRARAFADRALCSVSANEGEYATLA